MKVNKRTVRNFITVWNCIADTGPSDWEEFIQDDIEGEHKSLEIDKVLGFVAELEEWSKRNEP